MRVYGAIFCRLTPTAASLPTTAGTARRYIVSPFVVLSPREPELFLLLKCDVLVLAQLIEFFDRQSDTADTSVYELLGDIKSVLDVQPHVPFQEARADVLFAAHRARLFDLRYACNGVGQIASRLQRYGQSHYYPISRHIFFFLFS